MPTVDKTLRRARHDDHRKRIHALVVCKSSCYFNLVHKNINKRTIHGNINMCRFQQWGTESRPRRHTHTHTWQWGNYLNFFPSKSMLHKKQSCTRMYFHNHLTTLDRKPTNCCQFSLKQLLQPIENQCYTNEKIILKWPRTWELQALNSLRNGQAHRATAKPPAL
jgi:hypothetical protein